MAVSGFQTPDDKPRILPYEVGGDLRPEQEAALSALIGEIRSQADNFIFLSGGAKHLDEATYGKLTGLFDALRVLSDRGLSFAVGDGGTRAGIMEASGTARARALNRFPLLGVSPAFHIAPGEPAPEGKVQVDPNHSAVVAVDNHSWDAEKEWGISYWGSEVDTMFRIFERLSDGSPSVAIAANGGGITLDEVRQNICQNRPVIVIQGSGRAADVISALIHPLQNGAEREDDSPEYATLLTKAVVMNLTESRDLFHIFPISGSPEMLADLVEALWAKQR